MQWTLGDFDMNTQDLLHDYSHPAVRHLSDLTPPVGKLCPLWSTDSLPSLPPSPPQPQVTSVLLPRLHRMGPSRTLCGDRRLSTVTPSAHSVQVYLTFALHPTNVYTWGFQCKLTLLTADRIKCRSPAHPPHLLDPWPVSPKA